MPGIDSSADIFVTRSEPAGVGSTPISYKTDAGLGGNLYDGVTYWTGSGADTITIDGTQNRAAGGQRTTTILDTGLGDDNVTVNLQQGSDGFFVLETSGGSATGDPFVHTLPVGKTDNAPSMLRPRASRS